MPRTTLDLDPAVLRDLRRLGAREGKSVGQVASELLAHAIAERVAPPLSEFNWTSADLGVPLIDLQDAEAVHNPDGCTRD
ncbi:MAG: antitoxin [Chloroflexota bacterium]|mgnify:CR=1 FL=1